MKIFLLITLSIFAGSLTAQNIHFIKSYGNNGYDFGRDIKQDIDTGYIATGSSSSFLSGNADAFLLKVDSLGNFEWSRNYGGSGSEWGEAVLTTQNGGYAISGYTNSFGAGGFDFYFVKTNATGSPEIVKTYGGSDWDKAYDMVELPDGGFVLVGETFSYGAGNNDMYIVRIDDQGDTMWTDTYGGPEADFANAVLLDGDSLVVVGGTESFGNGMKDGIILKYHINGTLGWMKTAGMERDDYFTCVTANANSDYFLGGTRHYYYDLTGYLGDFWMYYTNSVGNIIADTSITGGSHEFEIINGIAINDNNDVFYGGSTKSFGYSLIDFKTDAFAGRLLNNYFQANYLNNFGDKGDEAIYSFRNTNDKGFIAIGDIVNQSTGGNGLFILKLDQNNSFGTIEIENDLQSGNDITLSIYNSPNKTKLLVYPTIATTNINIDGIDSKQSRIDIYNLSGQIVISENKTNTINVEGLKQGYYVLTIKTESELYTYKIMKVN